MTASRGSVVLLHGVGLDKSMWNPTLPVFEAEGLSCVSLDLPGHGAEPPLREPQSLRSLSEDVLSRMPLERVHLVGFSLGALIAQHIARFMPERLITMTSVSSVCRRTPEERSRVEARLTAAKEDFRASVDASIRRWFPEGTSVRRETIERTRRTLMKNDVESYLRAYTVFARGDAEIGPELERIEIPAFAITGELDPGSTPEMTRRIASAIPDCRSRVIPHTRHMLPLEDTGSFSSAVSDFIASVPQT